MALFLFLSLSSFFPFSSAIPFLLNKEAKTSECTFHGADFSPFTQMTTDWTGTGGSYTYKFNVCAPTVSQYFGSDCVYGMVAHQLSGTFCTANIATPTNPIWEIHEEDKIISVTYPEGGRTCASPPTPAAWIINFECDRSAPITPPIGDSIPVTETSMCVYEVTIKTPIACDALEPPSKSPSSSLDRECGIDKYNFREIVAEYPESYQGNDTANAYMLYDFNFCARANSDVCGTDSLRNSVAWQHNSSNPISCQSLGDADAYEWSINENNDPQVTYFGGSACGAILRQVTYIFRCSPALHPVGPFIFIEDSVCMYHTEIYTSLAC